MARKGAAWLSVCGVLALATVVAASARGAVIYVNAAATGAKTGVSWPDAMDDLQAALEVAQAGDEIWVAAGLYTPAPAGGPREASFTLVSATGLYGGFTGVETARDQRDPASHPTILSGDLNQDDEPDFVNRDDNAYHVVVSLDTDPSTVFDGFVVSGGQADGPGFGASPESMDQGSGLNVYGGRLTVSRCTFTDNWAFNHGAINHHGVGASVVRDCTFIGNHSA
ncbi:MAG TPA: hypothetical protein VG797_01165, partial [Phycisphaerales bacterium]|nr:hypothetical protein [Phycisphaerales bacterium]